MRLSPWFPYLAGGARNSELFIAKVVVEVVVVVAVVVVNWAFRNPFSFFFLSLFLAMPLPKSADCAGLIKRQYIFRVTEVATI